MAGEQQLTSEKEPGNESLTSNPEPEAAPDGEQTASPQPTLEEMAVERDRAKAAAKGSADEWRKEKERREQLEWQLNQMRQQPPPQPIQQPVRPVEPSDEELAEALNQAVLDVDKRKTAQILATMRDRDRRATKAEITQEIGQAVTFTQQQNAFGGYLADLGVKTGTPLHQRALEIQKELQGDPKYNFTGGNQAWIASIAAERARAEMATSKGAAMESVRMTTAAGAGSESGGKGNGAPPGKEPVKSTTIYLTDAEKRVASKMYGGADAEKKYWQAMNPRLRDARITARKAII